MREKLTVNRQVINGMLPDIPPEFDDNMRRLLDSLPRQRKEPIMKKKLSVGLVVALALLLLAIGALAAALLGGREFTDSVLGPKARETQSDMFTPDEIAEILAIAAENGIELPDDLLTRLQSREEGYYKEELMRAFAKTELGFYPSCWSIEDQAWYNRLLVACKLEEYQYAVVPEGDEIPQEKAEEIAIAAIRAAFEPGFDPTVEGMYRRHMEYRLYNPNAFTQDRLWTIEYEPLDLYGNGYAVGVYSDGTVSEALRISQGIDEEGVNALAIRDRFTYLYGDQYASVTTWSEQNWMDFRAALQRLLEREPDADMNADFQAVLRQTYLTAENARTSREKAISLAEAAALAEFGPFDTSTALYMQGKDGPVWKVCLRQNRKQIALAEVDDNTGAVTVLTLADVEYWARPFVLEENMPAEPRPDPRAAMNYPTRRPDGKIGLWGSAIAPDYFWEALDAIGYNSETGGDLYEKWCMDYGYDMLFWPLEYRALEFVIHELSPGAEGSPFMHGLPGDSDLAQDAALSLAWETFLASPEAAQMGAEAAKACKPSIQFYYHVPRAGDHTWYIAFMDVSGAEVTPRYGVTINAATGEVIGTGQYTPDGNG